MKLTEHKTRYHHYYVNDDNKLHGEYIKYHANGSFMELTTFDNGRHHGVYEYAFRNSKDFEKCFYANNILHGEYKYWTDGGPTMSHVIMVRGEAIELPAHMDRNCLSDEDKFELLLTYGQMEFL